MLNVINNSNFLHSLGLQNKARLIAAPAAAIAVFSIGSRVIAHSAGLGLQAASKVTDYFEKQAWSEKFNHAAHISFDFAKRNFKVELKTAIGLTMVAGLGLIVSQAMPDPSVPKEFDWEEFKQSVTQPEEESDAWPKKQLAWMEQIREYLGKEEAWQKKIDVFKARNGDENSPEYEALRNENPEYPSEGYPSSPK